MTNQQNKYEHTHTQWHMCNWRNFDVLCSFVLFLFFFYLYNSRLLVHLAIIIFISFHSISFRYISFSLFRLAFREQSFQICIGINFLCEANESNRPERCYNFNDDDVVDLYNECGNVICLHVDVICIYYAAAAACICSRFVCVFVSVCWWCRCYMQSLMWDFLSLNTEN